MRKFTKMMLTLALLFGAVGGVSSVKAETIKLSSSGFSNKNGDCEFKDGIFRWWNTGNNTIRAISFSAGTLSSYSTLHLSCSDLTSGAAYRVIIVTSDGNYQIINQTTVGNDLSFNIADFGKQWNESKKITKALIASATEIRIGGSAIAEGTTKDNPSTLTIDPTSIYLESDLDFIISSAEDWETFASKVNDGTNSNAKAGLAADISVTTKTMVGTEAHPYTGTFDGEGHTLRFEYEGGDQFAAPFRFVNGATFSDLKTVGSIINSNNQSGGIIGRNAGGNTTLNRCMSSMTLESGVSGNGRTGGLAGRCTDGTLTFNYCMFDGEINCTGVQGANGFVGYYNGKNIVTINHCLVASTIFTGGDQNFAGGYGDLELTDSYYLTKFNEESNQGIFLNEQLLNSGQAAWVLNSGIEDGAWFFGQGNVNASNIEAHPAFTTNPAKKVVRTKAKYTSTDLYVNPGGAVPNAVRMRATGFSMTDGGEVVTNVPSSFTTDDVEICRTSEAFKFKVSAAGATTLIVPFDVAELPDGMTAYNLEFNGTSVTATPVSSITADKPVLINAPAGEYKFNTGLTGTIENYASRTTTNGSLKGAYNEAGSSSASNPLSYVPAGAYVLQDGDNGIGFYRVDAENSIKITSFRAYLTAPSDARSLEIVFDEDPTGINNVTAKKAEENGAYFNLAGQRVAQPTKGLYIVNGKKVVIK